MNPAPANFAFPSRRSPGRAREILRRRTRCGFTLIEVLATLLLLAIVLPVIMKGFALATSAATSSRRRTEAGALAESKLNEIVSTNLWQTGSLSGDFGQDWPDYTWSGELMPWGQGTGQGVQGTNVTQELDVHVMWTEGGAQKSVTVSSLVYQSPNATTGSGIIGGLP